MITVTDELVKVRSTMSHVMTTMMMLGSPGAWANFIKVNHETDGDVLADLDLRIFIFNRENGRTFPETKEDVFSDEINEIVERMKNNLRSHIQSSVISEAEILEREEKRLKEKQTVKRHLVDTYGFRKMHVANVEGTTAELAERFGVSKKEIRRRKNNGTLEELFEKENS